MSRPTKDKDLPPLGLVVLERMKPLKGIEKAEAFLKWGLESYKDPRNHEWMTNISPYLSIVSYSDSPPHPSITFKFTVQPVHANGLGNLHGGCAATLFDACTTQPLHLISRPGYWQRYYVKMFPFLFKVMSDFGMRRYNTGVSRTLNVTYLRPVPVGSSVHIKCEVLHAGRNLCALRGEMRAVTEDGREGPLLVVCEHGKANTDPPAEKL
ncbi:HotDog domain-containing protein [Hypoxylon sp. FL0543]|nr:HotDog domain-containing protein [Hypoxylon sp. FL0543]